MMLKIAEDNYCATFDGTEIYVRVGFTGCMNCATARRCNSRKSCGARGQPNCFHEDMWATRGATSDSQ